MVKIMCFYFLKAVLMIMLESIVKVVQVNVKHVNKTQQIACLALIKVDKLQNVSVRVGIMKNFQPNNV
jgi:hypothetical protein